MPSASPASAISSRVQERRRRRKNEILHAALRAFRERGYQATTLDDIARHLAIRKTALYHYFPDKESLLYECHRESLAEVEELVENAKRRFDTAPARLAFVIREHVRVMTDTLEGSPLAFEVTQLSPPRQAEIIRRRDRYEQDLRSIIIDGIRAGEFRSVHPKVAAFAVLGAINWIARWFRPSGSLDGRTLGDEFAEHLVGGLTCP